MFYCDSPSLFCILINLLSIPIRLSLTAIILGVMAMFMIPIGFVLFFWVAMGFVGGFTIVACELISRTSCPLSFFMILFFPITALISTGYAMYETR